MINEFQQYKIVALGLYQFFQYVDFDLYTSIYVNRLIEQL